MLFFKYQKKMLIIISMATELSNNIISNVKLILKMSKILISKNSIARSSFYLQITSILQDCINGKSLMSKGTG